VGKVKETAITRLVTNLIQTLRGSSLNEHA